MTNQATDQDLDRALLDCYSKVYGQAMLSYRRLGTQAMLFLEESHALRSNNCIPCLDDLKPSTMCMKPPAIVAALHSQSWLS
ncbi:hypothetical protein Ae201684P_018653 [Aphanomyces euteiches]|nr:hypothetical protein Ae201684P_018653 [Aphanomyces euteiches]